MEQSGNPTLFDAGLDGHHLCRYTKPGNHNATRTLPPLALAGLKAGLAYNMASSGARGEAAAAETSGTGTAVEARRLDGGSAPCPAEPSTLLDGVLASVYVVVAHF
jgi:hypothetical protein